DSRSFPGTLPVVADSSSQSPVVAMRKWRLPDPVIWSGVAVMMTVAAPQVKVAVMGPTAPPVWLLTKCQLPVPSHVAPIPFVMSPAKAAPVVEEVRPPLCEINETAKPATSSKLKTTHHFFSFIAHSSLD